VSQTNLRFHGAAPFRVAVVHGGPGAAGEMAPVARRLSRYCGVLEPLQTAASVDAQIQELRDVLSRHAEIPLVLIGHSWGAWLSLLSAARYPSAVGKLILVGSAPFADSYVGQLQTRRLDRLDESERAEYRTAIASVGDPSAPSSDDALKQLGRLAAKADAYEPVAEIDEPSDIRFSAEIHRKVWSEASLLRQDGQLLRQARLVKCPVVAIHGDSDPHPAAGVAEPLASLPDFHLITLARCGHRPWLERYAKEEFYRVLLAEIG